jgi:kinetochore protein NNF1
LNAKLEANARAEFEEIIAERDAVPHLNELDRLVGDARARKEQDGENVEGQERVVYVHCICFGVLFFNLLWGISLTS